MNSIKATHGLKKQMRESKAVTSTSNFGRTVYGRLKLRRHAHSILYLMSPVVQGNVESIVQRILYNTKVMPIRAQLSLQRRATAKPFLGELNQCLTQTHSRGAWNI